MNASSQNGFMKSYRNRDWKQSFLHSVVGALTLLQRIHPNSLVISGDSVLLNEYVKQMYPETWYMVTRAWTGFIPSANAVMYTPYDYQFALTGLSAAPVVMSVNLVSNGNMIISPGLEYGLIFAVTASVAGGNMTAPILVTIGTQSPHVVTIPVAAGVGQYSNYLNFWEYLIPQTGGAMGPALTYTITLSSTAALPVGVTVNLHIEHSIFAATPITKEMDASSIISWTASGYSQLNQGSSWGSVYGSQLLVNSMIDPDLSVIGYLNNYTENQGELAQCLEVLQVLSDNGDFAGMKVVDDGDTNFAADYRGVTGMEQLIVDFQTIGLPIFCTSGGIFSNAGSPVPKKSMISVFDRLKNILEMVQSAFDYNDSSVVAAVRRVFDPNYDY